MTDKIAILKDKLQSWPGEMTLTSMDIADLLSLLDEVEQLRLRRSIARSKTRCTFTMMYARASGR